MLITIAGSAQAGKTTLAALLVDELAQQGYQDRLLIVDPDPTHRLALTLGHQPPAAGLYEVRSPSVTAKTLPQPDDHIAASGHITKHQLHGLTFDLLTLSHQRDLADSDRINPALLVTVERLRPDYDLILLDSAVGLAPLDPYLLRQSELFLLVVTAAPSAWALVQQLRRTMTLLAQDAAKLWLIYNQMVGEPCFVADRNLIKLPACPELTPPLDLTLEAGHPLRWGVQPLVARIWPAVAETPSARRGVSG